MKARNTMSAGARALVATLLTLAATVLVQVPAAGPAQALCVSPPSVGDWRNTDPATRSVTRIVVGLHCGDHILCDTEGNCTGGETYLTLRPYGKCHPTDCDWGVRRARPMADGWQRAVYPHSWATKYVWVKPYEFYGRTYLRVYVWTDFTAADGRTDYSTDVWMRK